MKRHKCGPRCRRFGVSGGTKAQQTKLRDLAKSMEKDPGMLMPECMGDCRACVFDRAKQRLLRIQKYKGNLRVLNKLARSGKQLERAYAAMLVLAAEEQPIMFALAKLPSGDTSYTMRGNAKKETLIGIQHFDDVKLRLLAYSELALKRRIHLYSSSKGLHCSGPEPRFPKAVLDEALQATGYPLRTSGKRKVCEHIASGNYHGGVLRVEVKSAGVSIELCAGCASKKQNLYTELTSRMLARHPEQDIRIFLEHGMDCVEGEGCSLRGIPVSTEPVIDRYRSGGFSDKGLLEEFDTLFRNSLSGHNGDVYVIGERCFENDRAGFVDALGPSELERQALEQVLESVTGPVIADSATVNTVLAQYWGRFGVRVLTKVTGDKELARRLYTDGKESGKPPAQVLRETDIESKSRQVLDALPVLGDLGKIGALIDGIARTYKALGKKEALRTLEKAPKGDTKQKSVTCGLLLALGALKGREWQFTKEEQDFGRYLADFCTALLESEPGDYRDSLQNLLTASGSGETL